MRRTVFGFAALTLLVCLLLAISLLTGPSSVSCGGVLRALVGAADPSLGDIVWQIRIPRTCAGFLAGVSLAVSGLVLQSVFRNPLAGPFVLGVSSGANLGVALVLLAGVGKGSFGVVPCAAFGAFAVVILVLFLSKFIAQGVSLLIVGLMLGYFVDAIVAFLMAVSSAESLRGFMTWGLGSFSRMALDDVPAFALVSLSGIVLCVLGLRYLNAAQVGDSFAESLGVDVRLSRMLVLFGASLLAAGATVYCGPVGFLGLASPHIARGIFRTSNHRVLLVASGLVGASLALLSGLFDGVPLSSVTSFFGAPVVLWIFLRSSRRGGDRV